MKYTITLLSCLLLTSLVANAGGLRIMPLSEFVGGPGIPVQRANEKIMVQNDAADAENLALLAERLFYTSGLIHVREVALEALRLNPQNKRAQIFAAIGEVIDQSRGILNRVTPLARKLGPRALAGLASARDGIPFEARGFFLSGPQDIASAAELQDFFLANRAAIQKLRALLDSFDNEQLQLNIYQLEMTYRYYDYWENRWIQKTELLGLGTWSFCPASRVSKGVYVFEACKVPGFRGDYGFPSNDDVRLVKRGYIVDALDLEGIKTAVNALNIHFSLLTSAYSYEGLEGIAEKALLSNRPLKGKALIDAIKAEPNFLTLKDASVLKDIRLKGLELLEALDWFQQNMRDLCGSGNGENRIGHLVGPMICATKDINRMILLGHQALNGPIELKQTRGFNSPPWHHPPSVEEEYVTEIDATKVIDGQLTDLKALLPHQFDTCGNATLIPDNSLGGLFPRGDFTEFRRFNNSDFLRPYCPRNQAVR